MKKNKFKVWDGENCMYTQDTAYIIFGKNGYWSCNEYVTDEFLCDSTDIASRLLQYTSVEDKNGKEIFEGDIVKRETYDWDEMERLSDLSGDDSLSTIYKEEVSYITYQGHSFWIDAESFGWEGEGLWGWGDIEVIGNIFINPELVEQYNIKTNKTKTK
jgi:uncharacterized phage protein (TIGR01671 family)